MVIGICKFDIYILESNSLKEKRQVVKSICGRLKAKYPISIAEIDYLEKWQRTSLGLSIVGNEFNYVEKVLEQIIESLYEDYRIEILNCDKIVEKVSWS